MTGDVAALLAEIPDPEIPVLTIADLGVLRSVETEQDTVVVTITPTYSGCPAMHHIEEQILDVVAQCGLVGRVDTTYSPAWTTDWITPEGRSKLRAYGIAPPRHQHVGAGEVAVELRQAVACPRCGSAETEVISEFGSTACKALMRCATCLEPFDHFKEL